MVGEKKYKEIYFFLSNLSNFIEVENNIFNRDISIGCTITIFLKYFNDKITILKMCNEEIQLINLRISKLKLETLKNILEAMF